MIFFHKLDFQKFSLQLWYEIIFSNAIILKRKIMQPPKSFSSIILNIKKNQFT